MIAGTAGSIIGTAIKTSYVWAFLEVIKRKGSQALTVLIQSDNRSVVAYITKQGGTKSLCLLHVPHRILELANQRQMNACSTISSRAVQRHRKQLVAIKGLTKWTLS